MIRPKSHVIMLVTLMFWPFMVSSQTLRGDINGDGILDESDISLMETIVSQLQMSPHLFP